MRRHLRAFERYVLDLLESMTCEDVKRIAIDEIAVRKGHKYMTIVLDLDTGRVIYVGDGRDGASLLPFWKRLRRSRVQIEAVATVQQALPDASFAQGRSLAFMKRREHLDPEKSEPQRLARALKLNSDLVAAYFLKEELSEIWGQDDYDAAEGMLLDWIKYAESLQIRELCAFAKTLRRHAIGILALLRLRDHKRPAGRPQ